MSVVFFFIANSLCDVGRNPLTRSGRQLPEGGGRQTRGLDTDEYWETGGILPKKPDFPRVNAPEARVGIGLADRSKQHQNAGFHWVFKNLLLPSEGFLVIRLLSLSWSVVSRSQPISASGQRHFQVEVTRPEFRKP